MMLFRVILTCILLWIQCYFSGKSISKLLSIREKNVVQLIVTGMAGSLALFQILSVPLIFLRVPTHVLTILSILLLSVPGVHGFILTIKEFKNRKKEDIVIKKPVWVFLLVAILVVGSASLSMIYEHEDWDDAEVVSLVTAAAQTDEMLTQHRELGHEVPVTANIKRVVSPFQMAEAVLSQASGIHPAIICHTLMPFLLIISAFFVLYCLGTEFFRDDPEKCGFFLLFLILIYLVGSYSTRNGQYFFLVRAWQGKSMIQALAVPLVLHRMMGAMHYAGERRRWILLLIAVCASCVFSNTAFLTSVLVVAAGTIASTIKERRLSLLLNGMLCCLPCVLYGGILAGVLKL